MRYRNGELHAAIELDLLLRFAQTDFLVVMVAATDVIEQCRPEFAPALRARALTSYWAAVLDEMVAMRHEMSLNVASALRSIIYTHNSSGRILLLYR